MIEKKRKNIFNHFVFVIVLGLFFTGCTNDKEEAIFDLEEFNPITNIGRESDSVVSYDVDLSSSVLNGVVIPGSNSNQKYFKFRFRVKNNSDTLQSLYYKIYYQNCAYKWPDEHELSEENFYGSWENTNTTFKYYGKLKPKESIEVVDSFRIVGNPRNEKIYYGADLNNFFLSDSLIASRIDEIKGNTEWFAQLKTKAAENKISVDEQLYLDALWLINNDLSSKQESNNRWKRNPRMGDYEFLLCLSDGKDRTKIPQAVSDIGITSSKGKFINPFKYFLAQRKIPLKNTVVCLSKKRLKAKASFDLSKGIFVDRLAINKSKVFSNFYNTNCGESQKLFADAHFKQYFHLINRDFILKNIPLQKDVVGDGMTRKEYLDLLKKYDDGKELIKTYVNSTDCPCKTVLLDSIRKIIQLINPGNAEGEFKKEHVGIKSRIGFTYGKWIAKIKFPELLSADNVWNGLTNAFWLLYQDDAPWNVRRPCNSEVAYLPKYLPDETASLKKGQRQINYSEIDFEILKESQFWPSTSYLKSNTNFKKDDSFNNDEIAITCTNWDMACHEPQDFNIGAKEREIQGKPYIHHRWDHFYKALTTKTISKDDELFKRDYYYFEIDWQPNKIIWRIGSEKNKMRTICIMEDSFTSIPSNQMIMVLTQEWHNQEWWPTAPYNQNFIPFPKKNIVGELISVEIE